MMPLYFYLLLGSVLIPLAYSIFFTDFIKSWKYFIISTTIVAFVFLVWDAIFTHYGVWGFNKDYCLGVAIFKMPIEEWLFFFIIPFCSLFIHFAFYYVFPRIKLHKQISIYFTVLIIILSAILVIVNINKAYTAVNFLILLYVLITGIIISPILLRRFYLSFLIILIPFFIVNGILTGIATPEPVVWYNNLENLGIRMFTIPIEDTAYAFSMLFANLLIFEFLKERTLSNDTE